MNSHNTDLKINNFQKSVNLVEQEEKILDYWDENKTFLQSVEKRSPDKSYTFYDGPPFATGLPHYGHILASTTKDVIPRYWTMKGYRVERQWGWDCHGLPVENIVEKELNLADKKAIEDYGIANFNNACRLTVLRYANDWKKIIRRLGRWVDMENDYKTMENWYMESLWWVFKQLWQRDLIYKGHKSMHICPRCSTPLSNFEVTQGYKEVKDISVYVTFKADSLNHLVDSSQSVSFVAWTTTPWTLPGNVLLAVSKDLTYALFSVPEFPDRLLIAARDRLNDFLGAGNYTIIKEFSGQDLVGSTYQPVFPYFATTPNAFRVVAADFVTLEEGSGIVHIAPAFGENDYNLGKQENIPLVQHVRMDGTFTDDVTDFKGLPVKPKDNPLVTDIAILKYLQDKQAVLKKINITHTYPHCWRCDTPLINYATSSWFVKVTAFKDQLLTNNQRINWLPEHIKYGRFGKWLENARDWAISRNRFWGTPLPVWVSEDGDTLCIGSIEELEALSQQKITDLHKPIIDNIQIIKDGKIYTRISEVLDCWFESGAMPYASFHYPFTNKDKFERNFPAEFISEGQDQTRGWFYTLHVLATALTLGDKSAIPVVQSTGAFKNVIVSGIVLAEDGKKMSKRLQNYPDPMDIAKKHGVDSLRLYLMSSPVIRAENLNFSEKGLEEIKKKVVNIMWNVFTFMKLYDRTDAVPEFIPEPNHILDRWLTNLAYKLTKDVTNAMESYDIVTASRTLIDFADDVSTWFLRLSRDRIKNGDVQALQTLKATLYRWILLTAPFAPFITELMYQNLTTNPALSSIHLVEYDFDFNPSVDEEVVKTMSAVKKLVTEGHGFRKQSGISLRQPLAAVTVSGLTNLPETYSDLIKQELNVKQIVWQSTAEDLSVVLDTKLTPELIEEGQARELIRNIQIARKDAGTAIDEVVTVELPDWPEKYEPEILTKVKANRLVRGPKLRIIRQ